MFKIVKVTRPGEFKLPPGMTFEDSIRAFCNLQFVNSLIESIDQFQQQNNLRGIDNPNLEQEKQKLIYMKMVLENRKNRTS